MKNLFLAITIVLAMQFTDLRVLEIKVGDIISLISIIVFMTIYIHAPFPSVYPRLIIVFTLCFALSLLTLSWIKLYPPSEVSSVLKSPGWISLSRYVQYIGCVFFALLIHAILRTKTTLEQGRFLLLIDHLMFGFGVFFLTFWVLHFLGIEPAFIDLPDRLKGGFVEGGPFGLLYSFYVMMRFSVFGVAIKWILLLILILVASQSKAGVLFFFVAFASLYLFSMRKSLGAMLGLPLVFVIVVISVSQFFDFSAGLEGYEDNLSEIEQSVEKRNDDPNLVMGRLAASSIGPRMFEDNMLLGVGFGNYSLARNNPKYLGVFPAVADWDLGGLGGIATYGLESGVIGVIMLLTPLIILWFNQNDGYGNKQLIIIFVLAQLFGVQLHFQYIWVALGIVTGFNSKADSESERK